MSVGGGLGALQFLQSLKRALELFISVRMSPLATSKDHLIDTMTPGEKKRKRNKHAPVIVIIFIIGFSDTLNAVVQFSLRFYEF